MSKGRRIRKDYGNLGVVQRALTEERPKAVAPPAKPPSPASLPPKRLSSLADLGSAWRKRQAKMNGGGNARR
jgi:hypothetical protein